MTRFFSLHSLVIFNYMIFVENNVKEKKGKEKNDRISYDSENIAVILIIIHTPPFSIYLDTHV